MPALSEDVIGDIKGRLQRYLDKIGGYGPPTFLDAGGSAAVFRVDGPSGPRAVKAFDPGLLSVEAGGAEQRRLEVQRSLIGHSCSSLIQTYRVDEAEGTAFMEMEYIEWPQLSKSLTDIPDEAVAPLITQLVEAVRFLEARDIVHRDIKPENIHISPDYTQLKLLDLGVAREFELEGDVAITDHGNIRPFLATAQYSSPEYLFRLDEPSTALWRGLNFYQVGAVLHDLIMKAPIFQQEVAAGNRWLVARAVLTKTPSFADHIPTRLASLKALAARCLVKNLDTRLQLVGWDDFLCEGGKDALSNLTGKLAKRRANAGIHARVAGEQRLFFDRTGFEKRIAELVRSELISSCGTQLPLVVKLSAPGTVPEVMYQLSTSEPIDICCLIKIEWLEELYERTANISISAWLSADDHTHLTSSMTVKMVCCAVIFEGEEMTKSIVSNAIAEAINTGLDVIENTVKKSELDGVDLLAISPAGEHE